MRDRWIQNRLGGSKPRFHGQQWWSEEGTRTDMFPQVYPDLRCASYQMAAVFMLSSTRYLKWLKIKKNIAQKQ